MKTLIITMGCRIGWLFCGSNSLVIICQVWTHCFASLFYCKGNVGMFHVGRVYQSLPDCCWSSLRSLAFAQKITNQKHYVKTSKASCCLCMSIQADMYEGRRGYGAQTLAVFSLFIPKCFGLRHPKVVTLWGRHERFWRHTKTERPVSHFLKTGPSMASVL